MDITTTAVLEKVTILSGAYDKIAQEAKREAEKGGYEAVGLLASRPDEEAVSAVIPLRNHSASPTNSFFVEPWEQYRAEQKIEEAGLVIRGIWHSHPTTSAVPSGFDEKLARRGELMAIFSVIHDEMTLWREKDGQIVAAELAITSK
jgi:proteasome lid subunit RPN8/RPN11